MSEKYLWAAAAFALGLIIAKKYSGGTTSASSAAHNEVQVKGDWWTYPGMWQAG